MEAGIDPSRHLRHFILRYVTLRHITLIMYHIYVPYPFTKVSLSDAIKKKKTKWRLSTMTKFLHQKKTQFPIASRRVALVSQASILVLPILHSVARKTTAQCCPLCAVTKQDRAPMVTERDHSHSVVPGGLGVRSQNTRDTPGTVSSSLHMRSTSWNL